MSRSQYEIHQASSSVAAEPWDAGPLAGPEPSPASHHPPLAIKAADATVLVRVDPHTGVLERTTDVREATAVFRVVQRRFKTDLAMVALRDGVLVNGLPALPLTVLTPKDSLVLAPGWLSYVTERVQPFVGTPAGDMLGRKCPFCRIAVDAQTRVVTCGRCGVAYHHETAESHPQVQANDQLTCFEKVRVCLSCQRPVSLDEYLVWDPTSI